jgi:hypothetical protein
MHNTLITVAETLPPAGIIFLLLYFPARTRLSIKQTMLLFPVIWFASFLILPNILTSLKATPEPSTQTYTPQPITVTVPTMPPSAQPAAQQQTYDANYFLTPTPTTINLQPKR